MVDVFVESVELEVSVDEARNDAGSTFGEDDVLVFARLGKDDTIAVEALFCSFGPVALEGKAKSDEYDENSGCAENESTVARAFAECGCEKQGGREGGEREDQARLHHGKIAEEQEYPDQGADQSADVVHLEDAGQVAFNIVGELLVDSGEQGDFKAYKDADRTDESVLGEYEVGGKGTENM